jgi:D-beta-D-heptose 7-phosphate kinase/D-beta-D-heptose 1-phosphate adenosyltransferase
VLNILGRLATAKVAIVGDLMLDVYIQGAVHRISPEAPVPVVRFGSERAVAGGAANVAANAASLGASVKLVGIAGQDENYARLMAALAPYHAIDTTGLIVTNARSTTTKTRIIGHHQQIARIDREDATEISGELELELLRRALLAINHCDLVIFSDYGKGVLTRTILEQSFAVAQKNCVRSIVDPKRRDFTVYQGASIITPNRTELALATGNPCETDDEAIAAARIAHNMCGADVLLKRSEKGMSFFPQIGPAIHLPTLGREVFDVSGAGDTVVAALGAALASNISLIESMKIANHAAGVVVGKIGTATVSRDELLGFLTSSAKMPDSDDDRLLTLNEVLTIRERWRLEGLTVGLANGCFDILHPGHVSLIRQAAEACDRLVVALNTDRSTRLLKGPGRPVQPERARADVIGSLKGVAAVILFDEETPYELIKAVQPDVLIKGADYIEKEIAGADLIRARGGIVILANLARGHSTTSLIARVRADCSKKQSARQLRGFDV